jgi:hypothetical protein
MGIWIQNDNQKSTCWHWYANQTAVAVCGAARLGEGLRSLDMPPNMSRVCLVCLTARKEARQHYANERAISEGHDDGECYERYVLDLVDEITKRIHSEEIVVSQTVREGSRVIETHVTVKKPNAFYSIDPIEPL